MNLYLVSDVLRDYSAGMVAIKATDLTEARKYFMEWVDPYEEGRQSDLVSEFDSAIERKKYTVAKLREDCILAVGIVMQVWGGS